MAHRDIEIDIEQANIDIEGLTSKLKSQMKEVKSIVDSGRAAPEQMIAQITELQRQLTDALNKMTQMNVDMINALKVISSLNQELGNKELSFELNVSGQAVKTIEQLDEMIKKTSEYSDKINGLISNIGNIKTVGTNGTPILDWFKTALNEDEAEKIILEYGKTIENAFTTTLSKFLDFGDIGSFKDLRAMIEEMFGVNSNTEISQTIFDELNTPAADLTENIQKLNTLNNELLELEKKLSEINDKNSDSYKELERQQQTKINQKKSLNETIVNNQTLLADAKQVFEIMQMIREIQAELIKSNPELGKSWLNNDILKWVGNKQISEDYKLLAKSYYGLRDEDSIKLITLPKVIDSVTQTLSKYLKQIDLDALGAERTTNLQQGLAERLSAKGKGLGNSYADNINQTVEEVNQAADKAKSDLTEDAKKIQEGVQQITNEPYFKSHKFKFKEALIDLFDVDESDVQQVLGNIVNKLQEKMKENFLLLDGITSEEISKNGLAKKSWQDFFTNQWGIDGSDIDQVRDKMDSLFTNIYPDKIKNSQIPESYRAYIQEIIDLFEALRRINKEYDNEALGGILFKLSDRPEMNLFAELNNVKPPSGIKTREIFAQVASQMGLSQKDISAAKEQMQETSKEIVKTAEEIAKVEKEELRQIAEETQRAVEERKQSSKTKKSKNQTATTVNQEVEQVNQAADKAQADLSQDAQKIQEGMDKVAESTTATTAKKEVITPAMARELQAENEELKKQVQQQQELLNERNQQLEESAEQAKQIAEKNIKTAKKQESSQQIDIATLAGSGDKPIPVVFEPDKKSLDNTVALVRAEFNRLITLKFKAEPNAGQNIKTELNSYFSQSANAIRISVTANQKTIDAIRNQIQSLVGSTKETAQLAPTQETVKNTQTEIQKIFTDVQVPISKLTASKDVDITSLVNAISDKGLEISKLVPASNFTYIDIINAVNKNGIPISKITAADKLDVESISAAIKSAIEGKDISLSSIKFNSEAIQNIGTFKLEGNVDQDQAKALSTIVNALTKSIDKFSGTNPEVLSKIAPILSKIAPAMGQYIETIKSVGEVPDFNFKGIIPTMNQIDRINAIPSNKNKTLTNFAEAVKQYSETLHSADPEKLDWKTLLPTGNELGNIQNGFTNLQGVLAQYKLLLDDLSRPRNINLAGQVAPDTQKNLDALSKALDTLKIIFTKAGDLPTEGKTITLPEIKTENIDSNIDNIDRAITKLQELQEVIKNLNDNIQKYQAAQKENPELKTVVAQTGGKKPLSQAEQIANAYNEELNNLQKIADKHNTSTDIKMSAPAQNLINSELNYYQGKIDELKQKGLSLQEIQKELSDIDRQYRQTVNEIITNDKAYAAEITKAQRNNRRVQSDANLTDDYKVQFQAETEKFVREIQAAQNKVSSYGDSQKEIEEALQKYETALSQLKRTTNSTKKSNDLFNQAVVQIERTNNRKQTDSKTSLSAKFEIDKATQQFKETIEELKQKELSIEKAKEELEKAQTAYNQRITEIGNQDNIIFTNRNRGVIDRAERVMTQASTNDTKFVDQWLKEVHRIEQAATDGTGKIEQLSAEYSTAIQNLAEATKKAELELGQSGNEIKLTNALQQIEGILSKGRVNSLTETGRQLIELRDNIKAALDSKNYASLDTNKVISELNRLKAAINDQRLTGSSGLVKLGNSISNAFRKIFAGDPVFRILMKIRQIPVVIREIDTEMTNLKRVTAATSEEYDKFLVSATQKAQQLGASVKDIVSATSAFARLGYTLEESSKLAESAQIYKNVGWLDIGTATNDIVATMKAFNITAEDSIHIVDVLDTLGNKFALTSADVGTGLKQSASALAMANNTMEQSAAMITAITEITQDASSAGNALKTLSLRIRSTKAELEEMGEEADGAVTTTAKLRQQIKGLTGVDILTKTGEFKSTFEIMQGIAKVWDKLSDTEQASLLESLAGKVRANQVSALISNWSQAEKALEESMNSAGTAMKENEVYLRSAEGRLNQLKASAQTFATNVFDSEELKSVLKIVNDIFKALNNLKGIALPSIVALFTGANAIKNPNGNAWVGLKGLATNAFNTYKKYFIDPAQTESGKIFTNIRQQYGFTDRTSLAAYARFDASKPIEDEVRAAVQANAAFKDLNTTQQENVVKSIMVGNTAQQAARQEGILAVQAKLAAAGMTVLNTAMSAIVGIGIGIAINFVVKKITEAVQASERAAEASINAANALKDTNKQIDEYKDKLTELTEKLKDNNLSQSEAYEVRKEIISIQDELFDKYGIEIDLIKTQTEEYQKELDKLRELKKEKAEDYVSENASAIDKAREELYKKDTKYLRPASGYIQNDTVAALRDMGFASPTGEYIEITGDVFEREEQLKQILKYFSDKSKTRQLSDADKKLRDKASKMLNTLLEDEDINLYKSTMESAVENIISSDDVASGVDNRVKQLEESYKQAVESNDKKKALAIGKSVARLKTSTDITYAEDKYIRDYFNKAYETILDDSFYKSAEIESQISQQAVDYIRENYSGKTASDLLNDIITDKISTTPEDISSGGKTVAGIEDISNGGVNALNPLKKSLDDTGASAEEFVQVLVDMGVVEKDWAKTTTEIRPFSAIIKDIEDAQKALTDFDNAISKMSTDDSSSFLTADELNTVLGYDNTLVESVTKTADGYLIATDKLVEARNNYYQKQRESIEANLQEDYAKLDEQQKQFDKYQSKIDNGTATASDVDEYKQISKNIANTKQEIKEYQLSLIELEPSLVNVRTELSNMNSKANSLSSSLSTIRDEMATFGHVSASTAIDFIANNQNWEDFIELNEQGQYVLKDSADGFEEAVKQATGYNAALAKLKTQYSTNSQKVKDLQSKLLSLAQSGKTNSSEFKDLQDELSETLKNLSDTTNGADQLTEAFNQLNKALQGSQALQNYNEALKKLDFEHDMGLINDDEYTRRLSEATNTYVPNGKIAKGDEETEQKREALIKERQQRITQAKQEVEDLKNEINRAYDSGDIKSIEEKAERFRNEIIPLYAPGTLLGSTDDGIREYQQLWDEYNQMVRQGAEKVAKEVKDIISNAYDDGETDLRTKRDQLAKWNEQYYGANTTLGRTESGIETYKANLREIKKLDDEINKQDESKAKEKIERDMADRKVAYEDGLDQLWELNEKYYGENGLLANTRDAIDNDKYLKNQRDIISKRKEGFDREVQGLQDMLDQNLINAEEFDQAYLAATNKWLKGYEQLIDDYTGAINTHFGENQKTIVDEQMRNLENKRKLNLISEKEYQDATLEIYRQAAERSTTMSKEYEDKKYAYQTDGQKAMYEEDVKLAKQAYDRGEILHSEYIAKLEEAWEKYYKGKKELYDEDLQAQQEIYDAKVSALREQASAIETQAKLAVQPLQDEIDVLNKSKKEFEEAVNFKVNKLNEQKSALEKVNKQNQTAYELQKAQYQLDKASMNSRLVYSNGGWNLERDEAKYQEAVENLENAKKNSQAEAIQSQIDAMQDTTKKITDKIDEEIRSREKLIETIRTPYDNMVELINRSIERNQAGNIDPELIKQLIQSAEGRQTIRELNTKSAFQNKTNSEIIGDWEKYFPIYKKLNGVPTMSDLVAGMSSTEQSQLIAAMSLFGQGKNADKFFNNIKVSSGNNQIAQGAYTQLFGSKAFDPNNDKINFQLSDGVYVTEDGAILFAKELAKNNKTLSERSENLLGSDKTTKENKDAVTTVNSTLSETNQILLDIIKGFGFEHTDITKTANIGQTTGTIDNADARRVNSQFAANPVVNVNVEGSADEKTVSMIGDTVSTALVDFVHQFNNAVNVSFEKTRSTIGNNNNRKE